MADETGQAPLALETLPPLEKPYLDSSVFLAHIKQEDIPCRGTTRAAITTGLFQGAEQGRYRIYTSFMTIAEVRRLRESGKELTGDELPAVNALFDRFLENQWIIPIEVGRAVAEKAQELGARFGMSPTDAVHLASAVLAGCNVLMVWDKGRFSGLFKDAPFEGVHVLEPYWEGVTPMAVNRPAPPGPGTSQGALSPPPPPPLDVALDNDGLR